MKAVLIKAESFATENIHDAISDAIVIASTHDCPVEFEFNSLSITVGPADAVPQVYQAWEEIRLIKDKANGAKIGPGGQVLWGDWR